MNSNIFLLPIVVVFGLAMTSLAADNDVTGKQSKSPAYKVSNPVDLQITQKIRKAVMLEESISADARKIKVETRDGIVTLSGSVQSKEEREKILQIAKTEGGKEAVSIQDQMQIK